MTLRKALLWKKKKNTQFPTTHYDHGWLINLSSLFFLEFPNSSQPSYRGTNTKLLVTQPPTFSQVRKESQEIEKIILRKCQVCNHYTYMCTYEHKYV